MRPHRALGPGFIIAQGPFPEIDPAPNGEGARTERLEEFSPMDRWRLCRAGSDSVNGLDPNRSPRARPATSLKPWHATVEHRLANFSDLKDIMTAVRRAIE